NLFNEIGTRYGGDGVTTFKIPDWRGQFPRGWDHGRGLDPNAASRANAGGGLTGDHVGTTQLSAAGPISITGGAIEIDDPTLTDPEHGTATPRSTSQHGGSTPDGRFAWEYFTPGNQPLAYTIPISKIQGTVSISGNSGTTETRPVNIYAMWIVKT
ncbi:MAG TPA: phage tail protein, partial [Kofleriaceae bacterium]